MLTEAKNRRQVCQLGVADSLGDGEAGDGDPGDEIGLEELESVARAPLKDGQDILESEDEFSGGWLVLELPQRVVREESLLHGVLESRNERLWRGNRHSVRRLHIRRWVHVIHVPH